MSRSFSSTSVENISQLAFAKLKRRLKGTWVGLSAAQILQVIGLCCVLGMGWPTSLRLNELILPLTKIRSGLYPRCQRRLLKEAGCLALCIRVSSEASAHCSTELPSALVSRYPQEVLWLLKSPTTILVLLLSKFAVLWNSKGWLGGLYIDVTVQVPISMVIFSIELSLFHVADRTVILGLTKIALPYCAWGISKASVIPSMWGRNCSVPRWVSWIHRMSQLLSWQSWDNSRDLVSENPSILIEVIVRAGFKSRWSALLEKPVLLFGPEKGRWFGPEKGRWSWLRREDFGFTIVVKGLVS